MAYAAMRANGKLHGGWPHAAAAVLPFTTRSQRALRRASSFGSLLAFLLIDFSRYFFDQGDS
ncbi:hypothetical protein [Herbaspirillum sp.]|uniref:hypothetical protein n=1 Tax=Herbaspirillum sp. TaxID=1890675 RepID=UPI001B2455A2|nr:hypothetical protein [Herbaspirillum sp.]MBO9537569.1 hypothetical protein [Herbaspirillum sp.]